MIELAISAAICTCPMNTEALDTLHALDELVILAELTKEERDRIWNEIHFAIHKMTASLRQAEASAKLITDLNVRDICVSAIQGAIAGLAGRNAYSVIVGGVLGAVSHCGGQAYYNWHNMHNHLLQAQEYARHADALQERLWRDE